MRKPRRLLSLLALAGMVHGDTLPYNPTRIILPPNSSFAYIFGPSSSSNDQAQLTALDISDSFTSSNYQLSTVSQSLPFLQSDQVLPYAPTLDATGNITVIAGACDEKASEAKVWQFQLDTESSTAKGTWRQRSTSYKEGADVTGYAGLGYLANSIGFSESVIDIESDASIYIFGGMCPFDNSTSSTWISRAQYSNSMLTISPDASDYDISLMASRGPPISQAGSSITALPPTYSVDGSGEAHTQQQDFVLLGGNTEVAFINLSQVALFSLPQQSWSFLDVSQPSNTKADLTRRQASQNITPRSGHTAVLSESGDSIIIFGGWVGDVNTPADPQLAILELGAGYGGSGAWKWTIPEQSGGGLETGTGVYGHGAAVLPGGIMMVVGGFEISGSSSKRVKRASQTDNSKMYLYNTTSRSWLNSYAAPAVAKSGGGPLSSNSARVGLGTGLGIGAALLLTMVGFYLWYGKRLKSEQEDRERALLSYSSDGSQMAQTDQPFLTAMIDGHGADRKAVARSWPGSNQSDDVYPRPPMHHATGAFVNIPSPTRGLRKGSGVKTQLHSSTRSAEDKRISRGSGSIHPIAEHDDEDEQEQSAGGAPGDIFSGAAMRLKGLKGASQSQDPFTDDEPNPLGSHPIGSGTVRRVPTHVSRSVSMHNQQDFDETSAANWTVEHTRNSMVFEDQENGFSVINGDDRTSSTLSDRSQQSSASTSSITRTMSTKTGAWLAAAAAAYRVGNSPQHSPTHERSNALNANSDITPNSKSRKRGLSATSDGDPFIGSRPTFARLQSEGDTLMHCRTSTDPDDPYERAMSGLSPTRRSTQQSMFSCGAPPVPPRRRPGLMGSLRRALHVVSLGDRSVSLNAAPDSYDDGTRSSSSSPTKDYTGRIRNGPRRAVSDGGALLAQKRGQKDWDPDAWPPYRDDPAAGDWGEPTEPKSSTEMRQAEEEWDVETAAVNRDFQVMFTVPKSKLRVVNDDMDRASLLSASDGGVSRSGSVRRESSLKALKVRPDGANPRLPSTEEENDDSEKEKAA